MQQLSAKADSSNFMLIYSPQQSPRLSYIVGFISNELFNREMLITTNLLDFETYQGEKINYGPAKLTEGEFWICNTVLLFEKDIKIQPVNCFECNGYKTFFKSSQGDFPFDILSSCFYLISRYEEYLPYVKDKFGRYAHTNSLAHKESFLHLPLINIWLADLKKSLLKKFPSLQFYDRSFSYLPTYDIDIAWCYLNKGWWRNAGGMLKSVLQLKWRAVKQRLLVICGKRIDPFDSYEWLDKVHQKNKLKPIYFFLLAFKQRGVDKNISPFSKALQQLIIDHSNQYTTGIHPSWQSANDESMLAMEVEQLSQLTGQDVIHSRQHYLRFTLPTTYRQLVNLGIKNEYSMGYGTCNGFRASIASSYYWYDLEKEVVTGLHIHPFCFMDATAFYAQKLTPAEALIELNDLYISIKAVNGLMITLCHNNLLGTDPAFAAWRKMYGSFLNKISSREANL